MRLRGLVFERFVTFERAEVSLCDDSGAPLDVVLFVGERASGKSALLRGVSSLLAEAVGATEDWTLDDVRRGASGARCRAVFDDLVDGTRAIITLEKELRVASPAAASFRAMPPHAFQRWRSAIDNEAAPKAALSVASSDGGVALSGGGDDGEADPLFEWFVSLRGGPRWDVAVRALDRVLWPCRFDHVTSQGEIVFATPSGAASVDEQGDAVGSVVVMTLELLRLSTSREAEELVYVIDDIDAHLHPRWQSRIIGDLRRTFPRVQLIATTHSPWVVASVEPCQVFRLERELPNGVTNVMRVSDRIPRGERAANVMDVAFGAPDLAGPRWLRAPSLDVRREVMRSIEEGLARGAVVYGLPDAIHIKDVLDAFGESVLPSHEGGMGYVFFIDLEPGAPWGHACEYVFRTHDGKLSRKTATWPPAGLDRFVAFARG